MSYRYIHRHTYKRVSESPSNDVEGTLGDWPPLCRREQDGATRATRASDKDSNTRVRREREREGEHSAREERTEEARIALRVSLLRAQQHRTQCAHPSVSVSVRVRVQSPRLAIAESPIPEGLSPRRERGCNNSVGAFSRPRTSEEQTKREGEQQPAATHRAKVPKCAPTTSLRRHRRCRRPSARVFVN